MYSIFYQILHVEAKINMWKTQEKDAKDPSRVAYCQGRIADLEKRMTLVSNLYIFKYFLVIYKFFKLKFKY